MLCMKVQFLRMAAALARVQAWRCFSHPMKQTMVHSCPMQSVLSCPGSLCRPSILAQRLWLSNLAGSHVRKCSRLSVQRAHQLSDRTSSCGASGFISSKCKWMGSDQPSVLRKRELSSASSGDSWADFDRESEELLNSERRGSRRDSEPAGPSGRPWDSQAGGYGSRQSYGKTFGGIHKSEDAKQQSSDFSSRSQAAKGTRGRGALGQRGEGRQGGSSGRSVKAGGRWDDGGRSSTRGKGASGGKTFPSRERDKSRAVNHDKKVERWNPDIGGKARESVDWAEEFFAEKWVHTQGRLSDDFYPSKLDGSARGMLSSAQPSKEGIPAHSHARPGKQQSLHSQRRGSGLGSGRDGQVSFAERAGPTDRDKPYSGEISFSGTTEAPKVPQGQPATSERKIVEATWRFYATCHPGMEAVVADELRAENIGAVDVEPGKAGVTFWGDLETGYRANLWLRSAIRVLVLLAQGRLDPSRRGGDTIYEFFRQAVDWADLLLPGQRFVLDARVRSCTDVPSALLVQQRGRDAICDAVRDARNEKPQPPDEHHSADLPLFAALFQDQVSLYRDMSGTSLHRRGYRSAMHKASLNEAVAAGLLLQAGWPCLDRPDIVLVDPMCGSGTFLIEAALMAGGVPPGHERGDWPFQKWPDFDRGAWERCCQEAEERMRNFPRFKGRLLGNDIHEGALSLARRDASAAGVADMIEFSAGSCADWNLSSPPSMVITNPPWGQRLMDEVDVGTDRSDDVGGSWEDLDKEGAGPSELATTWQSLGYFLKRECPHADAYVFSGNREVTRLLHMRAEWRFPVTIGNFDCRLMKYKVLPPKVLKPVVEEGISAEEYAEKLAALRAGL